MAIGGVTVQLRRHDVQPSTVSVGALGAERTITNVAAGQITGTIDRRDQWLATVQDEQRHRSRWARSAQPANDRFGRHQHRPAGIKVLPRRLTAGRLAGTCGTDAVCHRPERGSQVQRQRRGDRCSPVCTTGNSRRHNGVTIVGGTTYDFAGSQRQRARVSVGAWAPSATITNVASGPNQRLLDATADQRLAAVRHHGYRHGAR